jgi:hypothetical protein
MEPDLLAKIATAKSLFQNGSETEQHEAVGPFLDGLAPELLKALSVQSATGLSDEKRIAVVKETAGQLTPTQQKQVLQGLGIIPPPSNPNLLWVIVVLAFAFVLVGSFATIALAMFKAPANGALAKPELVLTMFTSVVGFLAGLFVPSPAGK